MREGEPANPCLGLVQPTLKRPPCQFESLLAYLSQNFPTLDQNYTFSPSSAQNNFEPPWVVRPGSIPSIIHFIIINIIIVVSGTAFTCVHYQSHFIKALHRIIMAHWKLVIFVMAGVAIVLSISTGNLKDLQTDSWKYAKEKKSHMEADSSMNHTSHHPSISWVMSFGGSVSLNSYGNDLFSVLMRLSSLKSVFFFFSL